MNNPFARNITWEISGWLLLLALIPLTIGAVVFHVNTRNATTAELVSHLQNISRERVNRLEVYVRERKQSAQILAALPVVSEALRNCSRNFREHGLQRERLDELAGSAREFLRETLRQALYQDILLINLRGDIVYSVSREADLGTNLFTGPLRGSNLAWAFEMATALLASEISDFQYYPPSKKIAAFIATPVFGHGELSGVLVLQIQTTGLLSIVNDFIGLGESGELVTAYRRADNAIIAAAPFRHRPEAFLNHLNLAQYPSQEIRQAVVGRQGAGLVRDYRGVEVLAAWEYVPSLAWGLVAKIDKEEAFAPLYRQDRLAFYGVGVVFLLVLSGSYFATAAITGPIKKLTWAVKNFSSGDFAARAEITGNNEVGLLAATFNKMAREIDDYTISMEMLVARRTEELKRAVDTLDRAQAIAHIGSWEWKISHDRFTWSDEIFRIFGLQPRQALATYATFINLVHPDDRELVEAAIQRFIRGEGDLSLDHRIVRGSGETRIVHEQGQILRDKTGAVVSLLAAMQDVTELRRAQYKLQQYVDIIDENVITSATDLAGTIISVSDAFCRITGYSREELLGKNHRIVRHPAMAADCFKDLWETITAGRVWEGEIMNRNKEGGSYWVLVTISPTIDEDGKIMGYTSIQTDITDKKKIEEISITDELTKLYNRRYFNQFFPRELQRAKRENKTFAFLMLDVDYFKKYNDTYGHQQGDKVLRQVGAVFYRELKRSEDFAFRLGGEEFGALITVHRPKEALAVAQRLLQAVEDLRIAHRCNTASPYVTASCGLMALVLNKDSEIEMDDIFRMADKALYRAKEAGRNRVETHPESI